MSYSASFLFQLFFKFLVYTNGGKSASPEAILEKKINILQNFIFSHPYESINFQPARFLEFKEQSSPLLTLK